MTTELIERIAVEIDTPTGGGDPVLMIHGLGGTSNTWTPLLPAFRRFQTLRFDLPGSGRSHRVEGPLSIDRFVVAALRVLAAAGAERAHVVAHSLGTIVAAHLAAREPKSVRSLALFGPLLAPPDSARAAIRARGEKARKRGRGRHAGDRRRAAARRAASAETRAKRFAAVAFVRESLMRQDADGYARTCDALGRRAARRCRAHRLSHAAGHRARRMAWRRRKRCAPWPRRSPAAASKCCAAAATGRRWKSPRSASTCCAASTSAGARSGREGVISRQLSLVSRCVAAALTDY